MVTAAEQLTRHDPDDNLAEAALLNLLGSATARFAGGAAVSAATSAVEDASHDAASAAGDRVARTHLPDYALFSAARHPSGRYPVVLALLNPSRGRR